MIDVRAMRAQLVAIRAQVDALLLQLATDEGTAGCPHPQGQRENLSVMGGPEVWRCRLCGHEQVVSED